MPLETREWDSRFFDYPVASISLRSESTLDAELQSALKEARMGGIRLLYIFTPPLNDMTRKSLCHAPVKSVGCRVEYMKNLLPLPPTPMENRITLCQTPTRALKDLALQSGIHSRFRMDEGFIHQEFERLYGEWIESSLRGDDGKRVYIAGTPEAPKGLLTLEPGDIVHIGLLAVDSTCRGKGIGRQLLEEAERFCLDRHSPRLQVATQLENHNACRFYETCGFQPVSQTEIFHAWLSSA